MFKYLIPILLLILVLPVGAIDTCPTCPIPTPNIVYVTVTVTIPVPQTLPPTPMPTPTPVPATPSGLFGIPEYIIYICLFSLLIGGILLTVIKKRRKNNPPKPEKLKVEKTVIVKPIQNKYDDLYEDDPPKSEPEKPKKVKKPKKPKSLLDQDFEF